MHVQSAAAWTMTEGRNGYQPRGDRADEPGGDGDRDGENRQRGELYDKLVLAVRDVVGKEDQVAGDVGSQQAVPGHEVEQVDKPGAIAGPDGEGDVAEDWRAGAFLDGGHYHGLTLRWLSIRCGGRSKR
jgi:hypothetical protein